MHDDHDYNLELLDNAIDYLNEAMQYYLKARDTDDNRLYKYCILHSVSFAELFLKHYISLESELLIYKNITKKIDDKSPTITLKEALQILKNLNKIHLDKMELEIEKLQSLRNNAQHKHTSYNSEEVDSIIGQLLYAFITFDENNNKVGIIDRAKNEYKKTLNYMKDGYTGRLDQALEKINAIEKEADKNLRIGEHSNFHKGMECEQCWNPTLYRIGQEYECAFCGDEPDYMQKCYICGDIFDSHDFCWGDGKCSYCEHKFSKDD